MGEREITAVLQLCMDAVWGQGFLDHCPWHFT